MRINLIRATVPLVLIAVSFAVYAQLTSMPATDKTLITTPVKQATHDSKTKNNIKINAEKSKTDNDASLQAKRQESDAKRNARQLIEANDDINLLTTKLKKRELEVKDRELDVQIVTKENELIKLQQSMTASLPPPPNLPSVIAIEKIGQKSYATLSLEDDAPPLEVALGDVLPNKMKIIAITNKNVSVEDHGKTIVLPRATDKPISTQTSTNSVNTSKSSNYPMPSSSSFGSFPTPKAAY